MCRGLEGRAGSTGRRSGVRIGMEIGVGDKCLGVVSRCTDCIVWGF